jgi:hypothetical protein
MQPKSSAKSCTADYNPKVYTDERSETSLEVSLFLYYRQKFRKRQIMI